MKTNEERINSVIATQYGVGLDTITPAMHLEEDLQGDSLDRVELVMALEDEFRVEIPDGAWEKLATVAETYALVAAYAKESA